MKAKNFLLNFIIFISYITYAQDAPVNPSKVALQNEELLFNASEAIKSFSGDAAKALPENNEVFIRQIGDGNNLNTRVSSPNTKMHLQQSGNGNNMQMEVMANEATYNVQQNGNHNQFFDFTSAPSQSATLNLKQQGSNIHVEKYGTNSITNKLKLDVTGDYKSLIIRSYQ
ncbi:hypothetical protein [Autumnicola musiva]|uniref:Curlin associated repeat-containing protein n=1 Tax=Autumnicola musiva TaxID=3075589 RepID=A0ABU3D9J8_9FLAO|nr:hypothetical protein [Zunongwangia sp. F117]MDT0678126.1 hypothetical protein [Zunongwangia sp. F117]